METRFGTILRAALLLIAAGSVAVGGDGGNRRQSFREYIGETVPIREEIDVFLNDLSWARFDKDVGYVLGNYMPRDGQDGSSTISTIRSNGARTSFLYKDKPCRINTYGDSFTACNQVNDGETWQESSPTAASAIPAISPRRSRPAPTA